MSWNEMEKADLWLIPAGRYKTKLDFEVPLSNAARDVLGATPRLSKRFVFTTDGETPISGFSKFKLTFEPKMLAELHKLAVERGDDPDKVTLPRWTVHDLRRTARSLMTRAGVAPDHAERCLGHVIGGVRGVYDRHGYRDEKRVAFEALAGLVARLVDPQNNVVELRSAG
jgi:integrase